MRVEGVVRTRGGITRALRVGVAALLGLVWAAGCGKKAAPDQAAEAPPSQATVVQAGDASVVAVDHPERFPLTAATSHAAEKTLSVTGSVTPDVAREIPVVSIASGRVVATHVRLGDYVHKGQLVMEVQSTDISNAFDVYLKAVNDERLARVQLERNKLLYAKGAIALAQVEIAQNAEDDAAADMKAAEQQLKVLGVDPKAPGLTVKIYSPASGFIIQQNVTEAATAGVTYSGQANAFVIADLSHVWILCDVFENDLAEVHVGQAADIHLTAYPSRLITGTVGDIGAVLDPTIRTAKVRIEVPNPGNIMRIGMFATAALRARTEEMRAAVPATAVLHLHDRDWVYVPDGENADKQGRFRRIGVRAGEFLPGNQQEILSGLSAGQQVVANALELQNTAAQ